MIDFVRIVPHSHLFFPNKRLYSLQHHLLIAYMSRQNNSVIRTGKETTTSKTIVNHCSINFFPLFFPSIYSRIKKKIKRKSKENRWVVLFIFPYLFFPPHLLNLTRSLIFSHLYCFKCLLVNVFPQKKKYHVTANSLSSINIKTGRRTKYT